MYFLRVGTKQHKHNTELGGSFIMSFTRKYIVTSAPPLMCEIRCEKKTKNVFLLAR